MKNAHILPTDKPSRLYLDSENKICITDIEMKSGNKQNIYITSSEEEIKEGDWIIDLVRNIISKANGFSNEDNDIVLDNGSFATIDQCIKIILTDNKDLIKDGIQLIDDKFLEWFVKNPSCEEVKIESWQTKGEWDLDYKIIIPKEPKLVNNCPKCGLDLVIREACKPVCTDIDCRGIILSNETLREWTLQKERQKQHLIDIMKGDEELGLYEEQPKQDYSGVHLRHCYQGEYEDGCKYGENDCPAKPKEEPTMITDWLDEYGDPEIYKKVERELELREAARKYTEPNKTHYLDELPNMDRDVLAKMWESAIPKLSSKQETILEAAERIFNIPEEKNGDVYFGSNIAHLRKGFKFGAKWMQDRMYKMNKETLEEAALRLYPKRISDEYNPFEDLLEEERNIFINGAKWKQEQNNIKYTEEEVIEYTIYVLLNGLITPKMWFEQFKNK